MSDTDPKAEKVEAPARKRGGRPPTTEAGKARAAAKAAAEKVPAVAKSPGRPSNDDKLQEALTQQLMMLGMTLAGAGVVTGSTALGADGASVMNHADPIAESLVNLAKSNPKVKAFLMSGVESAGWLGVAIAVGALAKDIAGNHLGGPEVEPEEGAAPSPWDALAHQAEAARQQ